MASDPIQAEALRAMAFQAGLDDVGWAPSFPVPVDAKTLARRVRDDMPPELGYVGRRLADRLDPSRLLPGVRTIVMSALAYAGPAPGIEAMPPGGGFVSRFAWCRDYHEEVLRRVADLARGIEAHWGARTRAYVDTGPVLEKVWAKAAGLGFFGRNGLLITPRFGSFVFLGTILVNRDIDEPAPPAVPDGCGACTACRDACPTNALQVPGCVALDRCLAHWTVTARTPPPPDLPLAGHLYGCDRCQDVCPWNRRARRPDPPAFRPLPGLHYPMLQDVLDMDEGAFAQRFGATPAARRGRAAVQAVAARLASAAPTDARPTNDPSAR